MMLFSAFEVVIHVAIGIGSLSTFGEYGMNTLYSPGLITSLFGFLPVSVGLAIMRDLQSRLRQTIILNTNRRRQ